MNGTIDDLYFEWLYRLIGAVSNKNPARSYWKLAKQLYTKPFYWFVPNDDNRVEDGKELRMEFISDVELDHVDSMWLDLECSMLEMMIALARRASFESYGTPGDWFWTFLENLEFRNYTDNHYNEETKELVNETLNTVIQRSYSEDGVGGLFPLRDPPCDQRKTEIRYQMAAYILESEYVANGPRV